MSKFFIYFYDGYVDYENQPTNNFDNVELFDTEEEAEKKLKIYQQDWQPHLAVGIIEM